MFVKLVNGRIQRAPKFLKDAENTYSNPQEETLREFGYKPYVDEECPNEEGFTYIWEYVEDEDSIRRTWVAHEIIIEEPEVEEEEASEEPEEETSEELEEEVSEEPEEEQID